MNNNNSKKGNDKKHFNKKKTRLYNSRTIKSQNADSSYDKKENKLNVPDFISSRKYEINSFELSQLKSKQALSSRCFQNLPRVMRRRAASHNVSRIPKRLRSKAIREMKGALSPTKNVPKGRKLYKLLQRQKILKVASRLKNDRSNLNEILKNGNVRKKFREVGKEIKQITTEVGPKINNSVGSVELSTDNALAEPPSISVKYGNRQKKFVWLPTHIWHAKRFQMSKKYGFQIPYTPTQKCFKSMNRQVKHRAVCFDTSYQRTLVITASENSSEGNFKSDLSFLFVRLTNSSDRYLLKGKKSFYGWINSFDASEPDYKGLVYFDPTNATILVQLDTTNYFKEFVESLKVGLDSKFKIVDCSYALGSIDVRGPLGLQCLSKILHFREESEDFKNLWASMISSKDNALIPIGTTFALSIYDPRLWIRPTSYPKSSEENLYDAVVHLNSSHKIDSNINNRLLTKEGRINSYKSQLSLKEIGKYFNSNTTFDKVSHSDIPILLTKIGSANWRLISPWFWVLPLWIQLVKIPHIKAGGLKQIYQFNFENEQPSFPADCPYTKDGDDYNKAVGEIAQTLDSKKPKSQVTLQQSEENYSEIFNSYKCDWFTLRNMYYISENEKLTGDSENPNNTSILNIKTLAKEEKLTSGKETYKTEIGKGLEKEFEFLYKEVFSTTVPVSSILNVKLPVLAVKLEILKDGVIENNARIYSSNDLKDFNVIGFVTTGGMNLNKGKCTGIGSIIPCASGQEKRGQVYIRNPGKSKLYSCRFECL
ncbi:POP1 [Candida pseudojiufengensis]|uniref:POP1 n=1 Tax=Candida pseudojiufengensis TaxID=497109 RepID=UPI0022250F9D|nr:POP1 [Candida pseudojiufengensis]KAI5963697.1 POP1 [Candida pseudojiufengensis]